MQRFVAVDILKWWAIAAVILIHYITSFGVAPGTPEALGWITLNQLARYCVPIFVALSGYTLTLKYHDSPLRWREFLERRVFKLLPLYALWSIAIYSIVRQIPAWGGYLGDTPLHQALLLGRADYQLYFVPMIFQLYLLFPVLLQAQRRWGRKLLWGSLALQTLVIGTVSYAYATHTALPFLRTDQEQYITFATWIFYFVLGMALVSVKKLSRPMQVLAWVLTLGGLFWAIYESTTLYASGVDMISATRFTRFSVLAFGTGSVLLGLTSESFWHKFPAWVIKPQVVLGQASYLIYLSHTVWLRVLTGALIYHQSPAELAIVSALLVVLTIVSQTVLR